MVKKVPLNNIIEFTFPETSFTSKPSKCQAKDSCGSSFQKTNGTRQSVSWLVILNDTPPSHHRPENWAVKNSALQTKKIRFSTDHLTNRNRKRALRKPWYQCSDHFPLLGSRQTLNLLLNQCTFGSSILFYNDVFLLHSLNEWMNEYPLLKQDQNKSSKLL